MVKASVVDSDLDPVVDEAAEPPHKSEHQQIQYQFFLLIMQLLIQQQQKQRIQFLSQLLSQGDISQGFWTCSLSGSQGKACGYTNYLTTIYPPLIYLLKKSFQSILQQLNPLQFPCLAKHPSQFEIQQQKIQQSQQLTQHTHQQEIQQQSHQLIEIDTLQAAKKAYKRAPMRKCLVVFVVMWPYGGSCGIVALQPSQLMQVYQCIAKPLMPACNMYRCGALLCCHWIKTLMCLFLTP